MSSSNTPKSDHSAKPSTQSGDVSSSIAQFVRKGELPSGLYVVATPIGNLRDVTLRALDTLASVDFIYAEDTRQTRRLLDTYGIKTPLRTYHDHNGAHVRPQIRKNLEDGLAVALVSDAGTPLISDPGYKLVRDLREADLKIVPLPGPSALTSALCAAGLPTDSFLFAGFMPPKSGARQTRLSDFRSLSTTLVLYETGNRLKDALTDIVSVFGDVEVVMARELTKLFETFRHSTASELIDFVESEGAPKGEIVLLVRLEGERGSDASDADIEAFIKERLPELGTKGAANEAAAKFNRAKRDMYAIASVLKSQ
jgi:16S rRNA (cytidine1402-2'-O)-methyltransferase